MSKQCCAWTEYVTPAMTIYSNLVKYYIVKHFLFSFTLMSAIAWWIKRRVNNKTDRRVCVSAGGQSRTEKNRLRQTGRVLRSRRILYTLSLLNGEKARSSNVYRLAIKVTWEMNSDAKWKCCRGAGQTRTAAVIVVPWERLSLSLSLSQCWPIGLLRPAGTCLPQPAWIIDQASPTRPAINCD